MLSNNRRSASSGGRRSDTPTQDGGWDAGALRSSSTTSSSNGVVSAPNPFQRIVNRLEEEERSIRKQLASVPLHPNVLLKYCASCLEVAAALVAEGCPAGHSPSASSSLTLSPSATNAFSTAHIVACRVEALLRHGTTARRRYNQEDFLNLCREFVHEAPLEEQQAVEYARQRLLYKTLQLVARICALVGNVRDSQSAFEEAWAVARVSSATCDLPSLLNYLSVREHPSSSGEHAESLWLASNAVWMARGAVRCAIDEAEVLLRHGAPTERHSAVARRSEVGRMLITALLRQAVAAMHLTRSLRTTLRPTAFDEWRVHRATLLFASLEQSSTEELDARSDSTLLSMVRDALEQWSRCLMLWGSSQSPVHHMAWEDRWAYQRHQSRQFAALHMNVQWRSILIDGALHDAYTAEDQCTTPALAFLECHYAFSLGIELVVAAGASSGAVALLPPPNVGLAAAVPQPPQDEFVDLDDNIISDNVTDPIPYPLVPMRSLRNVSVGDRSRQHTSSAALRAFTDRAFDLCHAYLLPSAQQKSGDVSVGDGSLPESRAPSPLPPPQPVAPIRVLSSTASSVSSFLHRSDVDASASAAVPPVSRDLFRAAPSISPDPRPIHSTSSFLGADPLGSVPSPAAALPTRRKPAVIQ